MRLSGMKSYGDKSFILLAAVLLAAAFCCGTSTAEDEPIILEESSFFDIIRGELHDTVIIGNAIMRQGSGMLHADSAIWIKGERIILKNHVLIIDSLYRLDADRVDYLIESREARALGQDLQIYSEKDSIKAVGTDAFLLRDSSLFRMINRPTLYLNYPDSSNLIVITADLITFDSKSKIGYADGNVVIRQEDTESKAGRAILYVDSEVVMLTEEPLARRRESEIKGDTLIFFSHDRKLSRIHVLSNGEGKFKEPVKRDSTLYDRSTLTAQELQFNLIGGLLDNIIAGGQAYSYYEPGRGDTSEIVKNIVSGDSIKIFMEDEDLNLIQVIGGAEGEYYSGKYDTVDSERVYVEDTVFYRSDSIRYEPHDSTISLINNAAVTDRKVSLSAVKIDFNTARELVTAYGDSVRPADSSADYVPVILKDGVEEMSGIYLEYSLDTERGMIRHSRSGKDEAYYGGSELYKSTKEVFYVHNGTYTSCEYEDSHYHFYSTHMKVIQGDRVIARPVVFYIEKLPLLVIPYYVFSMKEGRHSGFLPFQIGNFSRGQRRIENVGYYWAASEYWDILASMDYYENYGFKYNGQFNYNVRYKFSGSLSGSYSTDSQVDNNYNEVRSNRYVIRFNHNQEISPTFNFAADGTFISDKNYYTDFSLNEDDRLNRTITSKFNISKRFDWATMNALFSHTDQIDTETREDIYPDFNFSLGSKQVFGAPKKDADGKLVSRWYNTIYLSYSARARNYSRRITEDGGFRSRREFAYIDHSSSLKSSFSLFRYININPSVSYRETWYKIFETDQSIEAGIDASTLYRRYAYSAAISSSTDLYGTVHPNTLGVTGLRHVMSPRVTFSWAPEIDRHNAVRSYTGAGSGGARSASMTMSLAHLFQAKLKSGETEKELTLMNVNQSLSYNFEATGKKFSNLSTSAQTTIYKNLRVSASMTHDLYKPNSEKLGSLSPYLQSFEINTTFSTSGIFGTAGGPAKEDSILFPAKKLDNQAIIQKWSLSLTHSYSESGRGSSFSKNHDIRFSLTAVLTSNLNLTYSQYYSFSRHKTVSRYLEVHRKLHCFEGSFTWNIDRNPQGFGFKINVIMIPQIKYEKSQTGIRDAFF